MNSRDEESTDQVQGPGLNKDAKRDEECLRVTAVPVLMIRLGPGATSSFNQSPPAPHAFGLEVIQLKQHGILLCRASYYVVKKGFT